MIYNVTMLRKAKSLLIGDQFFAKSVETQTQQGKKRFHI